MILTEQQLKHPLLRVLSTYPKKPKSAEVPEVPKEEPPVAPALRKLAVTSVPKGALVLFGDQEFKTPCTIDVDSGRVSLSITKDGYETTTRIVEAGETDVSVKLVKAS